MLQHKYNVLLFLSMYLKGSATNWNLKVFQNPNEIYKIDCSNSNVKVHSDLTLEQPQTFKSLTVEGNIDAHDVKITDTLEYRKNLTINNGKITTANGFGQKTNLSGTAQIDNLTIEFDSPLKPTEDQPTKNKQNIYTEHPTVTLKDKSSINTIRFINNHGYVYCDLNTKVENVINGTIMKDKKQLQVHAIYKEASIL